MAAITFPGPAAPFRSTTRSTFAPAPAAVLRPRHGRRPAAVYRRRRAAVAALCLALALALAVAWVGGALGGGSLAASGAGAPAVRALQLQPVSATAHVVAPGDTLWSIARQLQPEGDVRPVVDALAASRGGRPLQVGERIALP